MKRLSRKRGQAAVPLLLVILGVLALLWPLTGCAPQRQWTKQGLNQTDFEQDAARCRREAAKATYLDPFSFDAGQGQGFERTVAQEKLFEQCMFSKGYRLEGDAPGR